MAKKIIESGCGNTTILAGDEVANELYVSDSAKVKIEELCKEEEPGTFLRVAVMGGGCSGFQYAFGLDKDLEDTDIINDWETGKIVIDNMSIEFMKGATVNFINDFDGEYFQVENPEATSSCGCGSSFGYGMDPAGYNDPYEQI